MLTHLAAPEGNYLGGHFWHTIKHQFIYAEVLQGTTVISHTPLEAEENKNAQARMHSSLFVHLAVSSSTIFILKKILWKQLRIRCPITNSAHIQTGLYVESLPSSSCSALEMFSYCSALEINIFSIIEIWLSYFSRGNAMTANQLFFLLSQIRPQYLWIGTLFLRNIKKNKTIS